LNRETPYRLLKEAALSNALPSHLIREALMVAFARGLMLGENISEVAKKLGQADAELVSFTDAYLHETTDQGRRFAAAFLLLHQPEARPYFGSGITRQSAPGKLDSYRDNWWCPLDIEAELDSQANMEELFYEHRPVNILQRSTRDIERDFVAGQPSEEAQREWTRLTTSGAAADYLGKIVFEYARSNPNDARVPEALHGVVRSGHFGCSDVNTWMVSRDAFRMLHSRYPNGEWAKRTPYWFKEWSIKGTIEDTKKNR
jgi:hypothetical protein